MRRVAKRSRKPEEIAADIVGAVGPHVGVLVEALLSGRSSDLEPAGQPGPPRLAHERGREHRSKGHQRLDPSYLLLGGHPAKHGRLVLLPGRVHGHRRIPELE